MPIGSWRGNLLAALFERKHGAVPRNDRLEDAAFIVNRTVGSFADLTDEEETLIREVLDAMPDKVPPVAGATSDLPRGVEGSGDASPGNIAAPVATPGVGAQGSAPAPPRRPQTRAQKIEASRKRQGMVRDLRAAAVDADRYHAATDLLYVDDAAADALSVPRGGATVEEVAQLATAQDVLAWLKENKRLPAGDPEALPF